MFLPRKLGANKFVVTRRPGMKLIINFCLFTFFLSSQIFANPGPVRMPRPKPLLTLTTQRAGLVRPDQAKKYCEVSRRGDSLKLYIETFKNGQSLGINGNSIKNVKLKNVFDSAQIISMLEELKDAEWKTSPHITISTYTLRSYQGSYIEAPKQKGMLGGKRHDVLFFTTFGKKGIQERDSAHVTTLIDDIDEACQKHLSKM